MADKLARIDVFSDYPSAGGVRQSFVPGLVNCTTTRDITGDNSVVIEVLRSDPAIASLDTPGAVIGQVRRNVRTGAETTEYWRVQPSSRASGADDDTVQYTARSPIDELARGAIFEVLDTGETTRVFAVTSMTPAEIIDTYVLPALAAAGLTNYARGTVDPTVPISLDTFSHENALGLLKKVIAHPDVASELQVRDGGSTFYIDLVSQIGGSAPMPTFALTQNVLRQQLTLDPQDQVTRCIPIGKQLPGLEESGSLKRLLFRVSAVTPSGGSLLLTVEDPDPAITTPLIALDDEFTGWMLFRQLTGVTFAITACLASTQQLAIAKATYPTTLAVGELIELRRSDPQSLRIGSPWHTNSVPLVAYVKTIDGVQLNRITVQDAGTGGTGGIDPIPIDGLFADLMLTFCPQILSVTQAGTALNAAQGRWEFPSSIASLQVGDLVYSVQSGGSTAGPPHTNPITSPLTRIVSLDLANNYAYVVMAYGTNPIVSGLSTQRIIVVRPDPATRRQVQTSNASANTIDLTENAPAVTGQIVLVEQWCAGEFPSYIDDPVAVQDPPNGYGIIPRPLELPDMRDEGNIVRNPRGQRWTTPSNPPDGWSVEGAAPLHSQNTDPAFVKFGGGRSWKLTLRDAVNSKTTVAVSPVFGAWPVGDSRLLRLAMVVSFYVESIGAVGLQWRLRPRAYVSGNDVVLTCAAAANALTGEAVVAPGNWYQISVPAISVPVNSRWAGLQLVADTVARTGTPLCVIYLDAVSVFQVEYDPGTDSDKGVFPDGSYANRMLVRANQQLANYARPRRQVALRMLDLERITGDEPVVLGGTINLRNPQLGNDTPRVTRLVVPEFDLENTELTLTTPDNLTGLLAAAGT